MQEGTADSTINGDSMYSGWNTTNWNFGDVNSYPELN